MGELFAGIMVRRLRHEDWALLRQARLDALLDAPEAFGATYMDAVGLTKHDWQDRITANSWWVAEHCQVVYAMCALKGPRPGTRTFDLMAVWTRPEVRQRGLASQVVQAALVDATEQGGQRLVLFVVDSNQAARGLYERVGFMATGHSKPLSTASNAQSELEMAIDLSVMDGEDHG